MGSKTVRGRDAIVKDISALCYLETTLSKSLEGLLKVNTDPGAVAPNVQIGVNNRERITVPVEVSSEVVEHLRVTLRKEAASIGKRKDALYKELSRE